MAVVAPSAGLAGRFPERTERGAAALRALGYRVRMMPHARERGSWVSSGIEERRADIEEAFRDPQVAAVLATIGGNHSAQLLAGLDMELIAAHPKVLCGYSDITSLLNGIHVATGLVTFYGPALLPQFGEYPEPAAETVTAFQRAVTSVRPLGAVPEWHHVVDEFCDWADDVRRPRHVARTGGRRLLRAGAATGPLVCGCLPTLRQLIGTPWQPDFTGALLVLDLPDDGYGVGELDADLWHLRNSGALGRVAGVLIGRMARITQEERDRMDAVVREVCGPYDFPVVADVECGHADPCLTLPIGCRAELDGSVLTVLEAGVG